MIPPQILFFQNIKIKLKTRTWMTLTSSLVIFQALEPLQPQWPHRPLQPQWPQQPLKPYFIKELPNPDDWIIPGTKMTNAGPFLWNVCISFLDFYYCLDFYSLFLRLLFPFLQKSWSFIMLRVSKFQNEFIKSSFLPKNERIFKDFCSSLLKVFR